MARVQLESVRDLVAKAGHIRKQLALGTYRIGNVHIGGPMSATDAAVALYYKHMNFDPMNPEDPERDRFILSKGHNGILLYTIFCDLGMYDWDLLLDTYNTVGHPFGPHPNRKYVKGIEVSTGSLGHGLSWAAGIAHANRVKGIKSRVFTMLGDGEMEEGSNWEAILYCASKNLDNVVALVDFNHCSAAFEIYYSNGTSQVALVVKNPPTNVGDIRDMSSIPGSGRFSGGGHGNPLQYSCLENPMDRGTWQDHKL